jgi:hypothetical protein
VANGQPIAFFRQTLVELLELIIAGIASLFSRKKKDRATIGTAIGVVCSLLALLFIGAIMVALIASLF